MVIQSNKDTNEPYATSFQIPAWGGVLILNRNALLNGTLHEKAFESKRIFSLFVTILRQLMGLPHFQRRQLKERELNHPITLQFLPATRTGVCDWELDRVMYQLFHRCAVRLSRVIIYVMILNNVDMSMPPSQHCIPSRHWYPICHK